MSGKMFARVLTLLTIVPLIACLSSSGNVERFTAPAVTCESVEIRTLRDFEALRNCTRVLGHVRLVNLLLTDSMASNVSTNVMEINDYLLVYRVHGITTLAGIFPKLTLIRGRQLLFERYAFVVYENRNLQNLGLASLLRVHAGHIRVESNPMLCYVKTVNWVQLLGNSTQQHFTLKNNKPGNECPLCGFSNMINDELDDPEVNAQHCWNYTVFQQRLGGISTVKGCPEDCNVRGCDGNGNCCAQHCLSDCSESSCSLCANLREERRCVDTCSAGYYEYQQRECITTATCLQHGLIPHGSACLERCPGNHVLSRNGFGQPICNLTCAGAYVIHKAVHLDSLKGCSTIQGSLTIELEDIQSKITDLEDALQNISQITGYLKVILSPQIMSLQFLRKLHTIRGDELIDDKFALYVVDNYHLTEIWAPNQNVAILKGRIYFHLNPRLCYRKIKALQSSLKSAIPISISDVSPNSNGEHVVCDSPIDTLNVTVEDFNSTAVRLKLDPLSSDDKLPLLGYLYYYKEAPLQNVTLFDGRHGCGYDNWRWDHANNQNVRYVISKLKPYTQYAYFVKTMTMTDYHIKLDAYSPIKYFRTAPSKSGPVAKLYYHSATYTRLVVHWWPPRLPNGVIEKYILFYEKLDAKHQNDSFNIKQQDHTDTNTKTCQCEVVKPWESGSSPDDSKYYKEDQIIYDEALPDLIYVSKRITRRRQGRSHHIDKDFEDTTPRKVSGTSAFINPYTGRSKRDSGTVELGSHVTEPLSEEQKRHEQEVLRSFTEFRERMEQRALREQDTGIADFPIIKPRPLCNQPKPSLDEQLQKDCRPMEQFEGIEVPGHTHSYTLDQLDPEVTYRITLRACAADVINGCSVETTIYAATISKPFSKFFKGQKPFD